MVKIPSLNLLAGDTAYYHIIQKYFISKILDHVVRFVPFNYYTYGLSECLFQIENMSVR